MPWGFSPDSFPEAQGRICIQCYRLLIDLPFCFMGLIILALLWRIPFWLHELVTKCTNTQERRNTTKRHFLMLFVDLLDIPFVIAALIITCTLWRAVNLWRSVLAQPSRNSKRK